MARQLTDTVSEQEGESSKKKKNRNSLIRRTQPAASGVDRLSVSRPSRAEACGGSQEEINRAKGLHSLSAAAFFQIRARLRRWRGTHAYSLNSRSAVKRIRACCAGGIHIWACLWEADDWCFSMVIMSKVELIGPYRNSHRKLPPQNTLAHCQGKPRPTFSIQSLFYVNKIMQPNS